MNRITTECAPKALGPYSQGIKVGGLVYTSGQLGIDPKTQELGLTIEEQTHQACKNIGKILEAAGSSLEKVVKTTIFVSDLANFGIVNEIYASYFTSLPARSCLEASKLPKNALVEIEAIAEV